MEATQYPRIAELGHGMISNNLIKLPVTYLKSWTKIKFQKAGV